MGIKYEEVKFNLFKTALEAIYSKPWQKKTNWTNKKSNGKPNWTNKPGQKWTNKLQKMDKTKNGQKTKKKKNMDKQKSVQNGQTQSGSVLNKKNSFWQRNLNIIRI